MPQSILDLPRYQKLGVEPLPKIFICTCKWLDPDKRENKWLQTGEPMYDADWQDVVWEEADPQDHTKMRTVKGFWSEKRQEFIRPASYPERVLEITASMGTRDRDREIIDVAGWTTKNWMLNPAITWAHRTDEILIGNGIRIQKLEEANKLKAWPEFTPGDLYAWAETVFRNYRASRMKAWSVHFDPNKWEAGDLQAVMEGDPDAFLMRYTKQDLVEIAACGVGAHPNALTEFEKRHGEGYKKRFYSGYAPEEFESCLRDDQGNCRDTKTDWKDFNEKDYDDIRDLYQKPYPNEHSCRLADPEDFDRFARQNCKRKHEGKCIDVIYGIKEGKSQEQALRFPKKIWMESDARAYCKEQKGKFEAASGEKEESCLERIETKIDALSHYFSKDIIPRLDRLEKQRSGGENESDKDRQSLKPEASSGKTGSQEATDRVKAALSAVDNLFRRDKPKQGDLTATFSAVTPRQREEVK